MKKLMLTIITCMIFMTAWAQKFTEKDLQGKWKLVTYSTVNASLDIATGKATVTETGKSLGSAMEPRIKADIEVYAENLKIAYLEIEGNNFMQVLFDIVKAGPFTIKDKDNYQVLDAKFDDGTKGLIAFTIKDEKLYLTYMGNGKTYIYERQN
ncbi:hypothetical protein [Flavobacterium sp. NRK1]|uniref:hypothetical protein n=1 Tax=Flavobacterium sp. NRK1 TaxID=2954929 RepID=UPI002093D0DD|nr:hypothetical protein [Flavobacterium sp. NRK1]MCO6148279.1 hypothetical protein [Flavobacterium sp. NRK1]